MNHAHKQLTGQDKQAGKLRESSYKQTNRPKGQGVGKDTAGKGACRGTGQNGNSC